MFYKLLIANRGEIALRLIRACKDMGIRTVAVHSTADVDALHVRLADESICIGPAESKNSYLNISALLSAAEITDADAVHPGYGFLAENHDFAEICENCGIKFVGPSSKVIRLMGNKIIVRENMVKAGIPVLPGSEKGLKDENEALKIAKDIGFPVILKAAAGGGGRGIKVVHSPTSLPNLFHTARAESLAAFGNGELYIEKYCQAPRHVEIQIMADEFGNIIHLGERDCSIQRRHQKLLEEAPSPAVDKGLREEMGKAAVKAARTVGYNNVGTVEFLLDKEGKYYFSEMNTRIQVEHPVTEMLTGIDIVKEQIRLSSGERLRFKQKDIKTKGHSIECRITAEDPVNFIPSSGKVNALHFPGGLGIRVDSGLYNDCEVFPYYDSLIAKVIVYGEDRMEAIARMLRALDEFIIEGISTNISFQQKILRDSDFLQGKVTIDFLNRFL
ncbi:MAG: acetyl-CoA carboxylase biotin carboxylase subunit [Thermodesulfobacteriota bacterium]